ncbi:hypothetical protein CANTEDRAFT_135418 [Yamadazyma tenuis ATCC 10573]|uniref:Uncharacterized protein n=1 Tax=Candida tenuis (strain ATCC 10573 / BCRC 21748 / CBS 615 / JCM 9827 / NBRC 10315 / NRRL Y-1498 / VKM Y-70) TaxID=590646 RepID=G3BAW4_CANTC|nr:uncharacterized protein CANTEDRAFT_135418 [Yamadazyma tenuis ATCC 10573]EGV61469.1 hypothetical protein CANTEDRAFT_135418 [Yamadazyma tenuis ATCC 10573]
MSDLEESRRSRSRVRGGLNKSFRIQDETIHTSTNVKQPSEAYHDRPHRSLSRLSQATSTRSTNSDNQLLQQALQNQNLRNSESHKLTGKAHPKASDITIDVRPAIKRWNSIQYLPQDSKEPKNIGDPTSLSPLTVIKDQYNTRMPVSNYAAATDNYYRDLDGNDAPPQPQPIKDLKLAEVSSPPPDSITNKIYNKMVKLLHSSNTSTFTDTDRLLESGPSLHPKSSLATNTTSLSKYQSESDDESEEDLTTADRDEAFDSWASPNVNLNEGTVLNDININSIMDEINDFQSNFVRKYNATTPQDELVSSSSRVQQKILDHRDLHSQESDPVSSSSSYFSLKSINSSLNQMFGDHNFKIQHETISSQYNQIRFRFACNTDISLYTIGGEPVDSCDKSILSLRSNIGPLGFLNRQKLLASHGLGVLAQSSSSPECHTDLGIGDTDAYLKELWKSEMDSLFPETQAPKTPQTPQFNEGTALPSPIQSQRPDSTVRLSNRSSFEVIKSNTSFAELAGKVRLQN